MSRARWPRPAGLLLGHLADRVVGDPRRGHPVAAFGTIAARLEQWGYADSRAAGVRHAAVLVGSTVTIGVLAERATDGRPVLRCLLTGLGTWVVLGGRSLEREAEAVGSLLAADDLPGARLRLTHLVGRRTDDLDPGEVSRAVIESVAENTSDAVTAPLLWGAVAGLPGLLGYRAANTLDAMVGHRSDRHRRFGWASARLDDVLNLPGARFAGLLVLVAAPARAAEAWRCWRRDAGSHPSPNAGVVEAAFAGALGVRLGGENRYGDRVERRAVLGDGRPCRTGDIGPAITLARRVGLLSAVGAAALAVALAGVRTQRR